jgi:hypothetical protein
MMRQQLYRGTKPRESGSVASGLPSRELQRWEATIMSRARWLQGVRNLLRQNSFWLQRPGTYRIDNS